jgi:hypothetical protein
MTLRRYLDGRITLNTLNYQPWELEPGQVYTFERTCKSACTSSRARRA